MLVYGFRGLDADMRILSLLYESVINEVLFEL